MQLQITNLSKKYNKDKYGLHDFSLTIEKGILGLLGPNGAGKSTLMKIIATISQPTSGSILADGFDLIKEPNRVRQVLGYLPQDFGVYPNLNAYEFMEYMAAVKGVGGKNLKTKIDMLLEGVNLTEVAKQPIGTYSGGMKQRIGIAQALLNDPEILIFDEPTVGLDPEERVRFRNLLSDLAHECTVILSSHIVSDIETIADEIAIMKEGQLLSKGRPQELVKGLIGKVLETLIDPAQLPVFKDRNIVLDNSRQGDKVRVRYVAKGEDDQGNVCAPTLEDAYLFTTHANH